MELLYEFKRPAPVLVSHRPLGGRVITSLLQAFQRWVAESAICRDCDASLSRLTGGRI